MVLPLSVDVGLTPRPYANWGLIMLTSAVFFANSRGLLFDGDERHILILGNHLAGFVGHVLMHADLLHLLGNMMLLWVFGNAICARLGTLRYLVCYLVFAIGAAMVHLVVDGDPAMGASGAVSGVIGMFLVFHPKDEVTFHWVRIPAVSTVPAWMLVGFWLLMDLVGVLSDESGIAHAAHLGGFGCGIVAGMVTLKAGLVAEPAGITLLDLIESDS